MNLSTGTVRRLRRVVPDELDRDECSSEDESLSEGSVECFVVLSLSVKLFVGCVRIMIMKCL